MGFGVLERDNVWWLVEFVFGGDVQINCHADETLHHAVVAVKKKCLVRNARMVDNISLSTDPLWWRTVSQVIMVSKMGLGGETLK